jgi:hypothetical protein
MRNNKIEKKKTIIWICLLFALSLGVGYAVLAEKLELNGSVNYGSMSWDVGFTTVVDGEGTIPSSPTLSQDKKTVTVSCNVGTSTSSETCIAKATIKNASSFAVELESNPTITFDNTYIDSVTTVWTEKNATVVAGNSLNSNTEEEIIITITTKELTEEMLPETSLSIPITITMDWIEVGAAEEVQTLVGKKFSILSDSYSTYTGYSNDTNANSTIGSNLGYFGIGVKEDISDVSQTWWMQAVNETGMELLVNNSSSGSKTVGYQSGDVAEHQGYLRAENLHDDTGDNAGTNPDIIAVLMGTNDYLHTTTLGTYSDNLEDTLVTTNADGTFTYVTPTTFAEGYFIMIHKIVNKYENADVYCFTVLPNGVKSDTTQLNGINDVIRNIADYFNVGLVDIHNDSGIADSLSTYMGSTAGRYLHPNQAGMDLITNTFVNKLKEKYVIE